MSTHVEIANSLALALSLLNPYDRYEFEFLFTAWLMLPFTDGSGLLYDTITKPFLIPHVQRLKVKMEGWAQLAMFMVNSYYIWFIWSAFLRLSEEERRFLVVGLGTIYPIVASTVAMAEESKTREEQFWLTYWTCYSILFVLMDYVENFVGQIAGFYSICAMITLYLFLPMFRGAETVFRSVLVPLSGQYENMLLHDAYLVKMGIEEAIPAEHHERVLSKAADLFKKSKAS
jgi:TB2/DP1, HVA22 family